MTTVSIEGDVMEELQGETQSYPRLSNAVWPDVPETTRPQLFELIWCETRKLRREAHAGLGCPTRDAPYGPRDPGGRKVADVCRLGTCLDIVHDIYTSVAPRLDDRLRRLREADELSDGGGYTRRAVRTQVADLNRQWRVAQGLPAKPSRSDGVPGRVIARLTQDADESGAAEWHVALFRMMRSYVCRPGAAGNGWPLDGWTEEKAKVDGRQRTVGTESARQEIRSDITSVITIALETAGRSWVFDNIIGPLQAAVESLPVDDAGEERVVPMAPSVEESAQVALVRTKFMQLRGDGVAVSRAARMATLYGTGIELPPSRRMVDHVLEWLEAEASVPTS